MSQNNTLEEIGGVLLQAESVLLYPHIQMDGDALGSAVAICKALRNIGRQAWVLVEDNVPEYLAFLDQGYCTKDKDQISNPDVCMCVDCGEVVRFPGRKDKFFQGKNTVCIDHHTTSTPFADYNYINGNVAATAEIIYNLLKAMEVQIDKEIGEAIFTGICTDTGNFQYSNATKESHLITADLYDAGIDHAKVAVEIYQNTRLEKIKITNKILDDMEIFSEGKAAMAYVTQKMLSQVGAAMEETEGVVETLRNIKGVEVAVFIKERKPNLIKVSMRAKTTANVAEISAQFGGGGHIKAAGCTLNTNLEDARCQLKTAIEKSLEKK